MAYSFRQASHLLRPGFTLLSTALLLTGCGGGGGGGGSDNNNPDNAEIQVKVQFQPQVNGQDFVCGTTYSNVGIGSPGTYKITDWRFYVHDVALVKADGSRETLNLTQDGVWQYQNLALLDMRKDCGSGSLPFNAVMTGTAPNTDYVGICFKVGVPDSLNHVNNATAPSPLNSSGMFWTWRDGYKFIRVDGIGDPGNLNQSFVIHLGSTACPGSDPNAPPTSTCGYPNVAEYCLDNFDAGKDGIVMDIGHALAASNVVVNTPDTAPGCMSGNSDPECIPIMPRLNLDFTFVLGAGATPEFYPKVVPQTLFSVRKP